MIYDGAWHMEKNEANKKIMQVEHGAESVDYECWIYGEEVEVSLEGGNYYAAWEETKGSFEKINIPETVWKIQERAFYRMETLKEINILDSVTVIGQEAFKGCMNLAAVTAPKVKVSEVTDAETKMKLAFGFCLHPELYHEEVAEDYKKYLRRQKSRLLSEAERFRMPEIAAFLGEPSDNKKRKRSAKDVVISLEKTVLTGTVPQLEEFFSKEKSIELTARALGIACRCRTPEFVQCLIENHASFSYTDAIATKYKLKFRPTDRYYDACFWLMPIVNNIWDKFLFGFMEKDYRKEHINIVEVENYNREIDLSEIPEEFQMESSAIRAKNIWLLKENNLLHPEALNQMLYYSVFEEDTEMTAALEAMGAELTDPSVVAKTDHKCSISELQRFLAILSLKKDAQVLGILKEYNRLMQKNGKKMYLNDKKLDAFLFGRSEPVLRELLRNADLSAINRKEYMELVVRWGESDRVQVLLDHQFITSPSQRDYLIEIAKESGKIDVLAQLLEYKNQTADFEKEQKRAEKKLMQEFNADPNSASELKKLWITKKKEDGTLIITGYKGDQTVVEVPEKIGRSIVTEIGKNAFSPEAPRIHNQETREQIVRIVLPDTIRKVGDYAFSECKMLEEILLPDSIEYFGSGAFLNCENLKQLRLPKHLKGKVSWYVFSGCKKIEELYFPSGVTVITEWCFERCNKLKKIHFKKQLKDLSFSSIEELKKHLTIYAPSGSYAEAYAKEHHISFVAE